MKNFFLERLKIRLTFLYFSRKLSFPYSRIINYITSSKALPTPLSSEEEHALLERLKVGEDSEVRII